jgi:hypothetical protein
MTTTAVAVPTINPKTAISRRLRWRSWMYSGGSLFIFGLLIFAFGYGFEKFRHAETDVIAATEKERQSLVKTSADISARISSVSKLLAYDAERKKIDPASTDETIRGKLVEANKKYKALETSLDLGDCLGDCIDQKLVELKSQKDDARKIIESTTPYVVNLAGKRSESDAKGSFIDSSTAYLIAGASTKFGILTLLLFLLVILGRLYQYMSRLSNFYASRADALDLLGEIEAKDNHELLHSLTRIMSPAFAVMGKDTEGVFGKILSGATDKAEAILKPQEKDKK